MLYKKMIIKKVFIKKSIRKKCRIKKSFYKKSRIKKYYKKQCYKKITDPRKAISVKNEPEAVLFFIERKVSIRKTNIFRFLH